MGFFVFRQFLKKSFGPVDKEWGLSFTSTLTFSCQCAEGKHEWC